MDDDLSILGRAWFGYAAILIIAVGAFSALLGAL
jgi:hypothetical protein